MLEIPSHYNLVKNYINEKLVENKHLTIIIIYKLDLIGYIRLSSYFRIWELKISTKNKWFTYSQIFINDFQYLILGTYIAT